MKAVKTVTALSADTLSDRVSDALYELESAGMDVVGLVVTGSFVHTVVITYEDNQPWDARVAAYQRRHEKWRMVVQLIGGFILLALAIWIALAQVFQVTMLLPYQVAVTIALLAAGLAFVELVCVAFKLSIANLALYLIGGYIGGAFVQWLVPEWHWWLCWIVSIAGTTTLLFGIQAGITRIRATIRHFTMNHKHQRRR